MIITFGDALELDLYCTEGEPPRLAGLRVEGSAIAAESTDSETRTILPLSHIELAGHARDHINGKRHIGGAVSSRLQYVAHSVTESNGSTLLEITSLDPVTGLTVVACLEQHPDIAAVRAWTRVVASQEVVLLHITSILVPGLLPVGPDRWEDRLTAWTAANPWCGEGRWTSATLSERGLTTTDRPDARNRFALSSTGSWSSSEYIPMGALTDERTGRAVVWQIEHNGSWAWEVGDTYDAVYVGLSGPCDAENQWSPPGRRSPPSPSRSPPRPMASKAASASSPSTAASPVAPTWTPNDCRSSSTTT